jgi:hypothetical protein
MIRAFLARDDAIFRQSLRMRTCSLLTYSVSIVQDSATMPSMEHPHRFFVANLFIGDSSE